MSRTIVQTFPVIDTRVVEVEVPGIQGPKGPMGDLTPEAEAVRAEINQAKTDAQTAATQAADSAEAAETSAENAEQAYQNTLTAKSDALSAIQEEANTQLGLIEDEGEEQVAAVQSEGSTAVTGVQIEAGKQIERIQTEGGKQVNLTIQYATQAGESAEAAKESEDNAKDSETAAKTSEDNAKESETNAKTSEETATAAADEAVEAKGAALAAQTAAEAAQAAAEAAEDRCAEIEVNIGSPLGKQEAAETYATKVELTNGLAGKSDTTHTHTHTGITDWDTELAKKSDVGHGHEIADVEGLQTALDSKQGTGDYATNTALETGLAGKSDVGHGHVIADVENLQTTLDGKQPVGDYATNTALTEGLAQKSDTTHTHTHEGITDWDEQTANYWSTARSLTGAIPDTGSMGWSTIWSGTVGDDAVTTGLSVEIDEGDPTLTLQAKRGLEYGQIVLSKSDIKLQTGQGKELSVNSLMTTVGALGTTYAPLSHSHTIADLPKASETDATTGTDDTKVMTPLVTKAAILALAPAPDLTPYATVEALNTLQSTVTALQSTVNTINSSYMPKSGGTFTGAVTVQGQIKGTSFRVG